MMKELSGFALIVGNFEIYEITDKRLDRSFDLESILQ